MLRGMNTPRIHPPSILLGALLSLAVAFAATGDAASPAAASYQRAPAAAPWQLVVSENNGRRYLLESETGRLFHHEGDRWTLAASAPE